MTLIDVLITRAFPAETVRPLAQSRVIEQGRPDAFMPRAELLDRIRGARAVIVYGADRVDEELLTRGRRLEIVSGFGVGYDGIDVDSATRHGIWVSNTPDVLTEATADVALLLLLAALRRAAEGYEQVRHGAWTEVRPDALWGRDLAGQTLGILGFGRIGQALARRVAPLGMNVIYHSRSRVSEELEHSMQARWVSFGDLLTGCDVLSVHVPLTPETRGMIGPKELALMRVGSYLVNAARGPIVDEGALISALEAGHIAGVGLDVFANEPEVPAQLREHPRAFCLPHIGSAAVATRGAMMKLCLDNVEAVLAGDKPITPVNRVTRRGTQQLPETG